MSRVDISEVRGLLADVVGDERATERLTAESRLYGALPELDSIAVVNLLLAIERRFDIVVDDEEVEEALFVTLGSLHAFVAAKVERRARAGGRGD